MATKPVKKKIVAPNLVGNTHLESSPLNLLSLREHGRNEINNLLSKVPGKTKHLIWDPQLIGPLNYIIQPKVLNNLGIQLRTNLNITSDRINSDCDSIIYMSYPTVVNMKAISKQIVTHSKGRTKNFYLFLMPRRTFLSIRCLKMYGAYGSLNPLGQKSHISDLNIEWYPVDSDVISLCIPDCLSSLISGNISSLLHIASSLNSLQAVFGRFPIIRSKGDFSCCIVDIMSRLIFEDIDLYNNNSNNIKSVISQCIIIDRTIDMITPCLTPRTYEGLLDSVFNISNCIIRVSKNLLGKSQQKSRNKASDINIVLNSSDLIFKQVRDTNFRYLGKLLSTMAKHISAGYQERHLAKTSRELNAYIKRFKNLHADHSLVEQHVHLADYISAKTTKKMKWKRKLEHEFSILCNEQVPSGVTHEDYLLELIGRRENIQIVLKFLILISLTQSGISSKKYDLIKKDIIQTYGCKYLLTLDLLEKYLLITKYETLKRLYSSSSYEYINWTSIKNKFNLLKKPQELNQILINNSSSTSTSNSAAEQIAEMVSNPSILGQYDINLIGNGYAPLTARLIEAATRPNGWKAIQSELKEIKGKQYINKNMDDIHSQNNDDIKQNNPFGNNDDIKQSKKQRAQQKSDAMSTHKTILVFFVGGVTYSEISAIRMLEQRPNTPWKFIVASTNICSGNDIINAFIDKDIPD